MAAHKALAAMAGFAKLALPSVPGQPAYGAEFVDCITLCFCVNAGGAGKYASRPPPPCKRALAMP
jgi:hypothetical protein